MAPHSIPLCGTLSVFGTARDVHWLGSQEAAQTLGSLQGYGMGPNVDAKQRGGGKRMALPYRTRSRQQWRLKLVGRYPGPSRGRVSNRITVLGIPYPLFPPSVLFVLLPRE